MKRKTGAAPRKRGRPHSIALRVGITLRVIEHRKAQGISQEALSLKLGVAFNAVWRIEAGLAPCSYPLAKAWLEWANGALKWEDFGFFVTPSGQLAMLIDAHADGGR